MSIKRNTFNYLFIRLINEEQEYSFLMCYVHDISWITFYNWQ